MNAQTKFPMTWEESVMWLKNDPKNQFLVNACYFDDPIEEAAKRYYKEDEWLAVKKLLPTKKGSALDVGSGRGISAYALAKDGWDVTALEPDPSAIVGSAAIQELMTKTGVNIRVVSDWGEKLPFRNENFDAIHARQVLHHARDLKQFCKELYRVCKPGGILIATREHVIDKKEDLPQFLASHPLHHLYGGENAYLVQDYLTALSDAGFNIEKTLSPLETPINYFPATRDDIDRIVLKRIPTRLINFFPPLPAFIIRYFSRNHLKTPGRLYTFIASKPYLNERSSK